MKGALTISEKEVEKIMSQYVSGIVLQKDVRITYIHDYYGALKVEFSNEPEEKEGE